MEIDNNPRKRCRDDESELDLHMHGIGNHVAKRARQSDVDASPRDPTPPSPIESGSEPSESGPSTPASIDVEMEDDFRAPGQQPEHLLQPPQPQPQPQPVARSQGTIISGWNQAQRDRYLRQGYPLSWVQGYTRVSNGSSVSRLVVVAKADTGTAQN